MLVNFKFTSDFSACGSKNSNETRSTSEVQSGQQRDIFRARFRSNHENSSPCSSIQIQNLQLNTFHHHKAWACTQQREQEQQ